jgi:hypothetical protein
MRLLCGLATILLLIVSCADAGPDKEEAPPTTPIDYAATIAATHTEAAEDSSTPTPPGASASEGALADGSLPRLPTALVSRVIDGDTVELGDGSRGPLYRHGHTRDSR